MNNKSKKNSISAFIAVEIVLCLLSVENTSLAGDKSKGETSFSSHLCSSCHSIGKTGTALTGPNLAGITRRRTEAWLKKWIMHPEQMMGDPAIQEMSIKYPTPMPNLGVTEAEAEDLIAYLKSR